MIQFQAQFFQGIPQDQANSAVVQAMTTTSEIAKNVRDLLMITGTVQKELKEETKILKETSRENKIILEGKQSWQ